MIVFRELIANLCYEIAEINIFSAIMQKRISAIGDFLMGKGGGTSFGSRFVLMGRSWNSFLKNPVFGIPFKDYKNGTVGLHETWVSMLGTMGLFGTFLYLCSLALMLKNIFANIKVKYFGVAFKVVILLCVFISFLNPMTSRDVLIAIFVVLPLYESLFKTKAKKLIK